jgi:transposase-like protein
MMECKGPHCGCKTRHEMRFNEAQELAWFCANCGQERVRKTRKKAEARKAEDALMEEILKGID